MLEQLELLHVSKYKCWKIHWHFPSINQRVLKIECMNCMTHGLTEQMYRHVLHTCFNDGVLELKECEQCFFILV